jgi:mitotic spindle assembly checkpoint protein MAD1
MDDLRRELNEAQLQRQILEDERKSWTSYLQNEGSTSGEIEFDSPEALARAVVRERLEKATLLERLGAVEPGCRRKMRSLKAWKPTNASCKAMLKSCELVAGLETVE